MQHPAVRVISQLWLINGRKPLIVQCGTGLQLFNMILSAKPPLLTIFMKQPSVSEDHKYFITIFMAFPLKDDILSFSIDWCLEGNNKAKQEENLSLKFISVKTKCIPFSSYSHELTKLISTCIGSNFIHKFKVWMN